MSYPAPTYALTSDALVYYVRPAGNDNNDGLSVGAAFATWDRAMAALRRDVFGRQQIIDLTGMTISEANQKVVPCPVSGINFDLDGLASAPDNFFYRTKIQLRASMSLDTSITINTVTPDAVTGLMTLTVAETLVVNAHIGQIVAGDAITEYGVVVSNTANDIFVAAVPAAIPTGAAGIYDPGATLTLGDNANFFQQALYMFSWADVSITGISFNSTASSKAAALTLYPVLPVNLLMCSFEGIAFEQGGGIVTMDSCYVHDKNYGQNGSPVLARGCFFDSITMNVHGDGGSGLGGYIGCVWDGCDPVNSGNTQTRAHTDIQNSEIRNATSAGAVARFGICSIADTRIDDSGADGILCDKPIFLFLSNVVGTGNTEYGISILNGAQVSDGGVNTITGASGDIELGVGNLVTWAGVPATSATEFARIF